MKKILLFFMLTIGLKAMATECFIGEVRMFAGNFAPRNWAFAHGQLLPIAQNQALFSILGTIYGGDGRTTFALPDLRGRVPVGAGRGPGLTNIRQGAKGGSENFVLTQQNLPAVQATTQIPGLEIVEELQLKKGKINVPKVAPSQVEIESNLGGNSQPVLKRDPYTGINYIVCLFGIYPSRQ